MKIKLFIVSSLWDVILVLITALSLDYAVLSGFDSTIEFRAAFVLQVLLTLPLLLILFAGSWSKKAMLFSALGAVLWIAGVMVVSVALSSPEVPLFIDGTVNDVSGNYSIFCFTVLLLATLAFILTRRPVGAIAFLVFGVLVSGCVQFLFSGWLWEEGGLVDVLAFLASAGTMVVYQRYRQQASKVDLLVRPAFFSVFLQGALGVVLCLGVGILVWGAIISPMELGTPTLKPFERTIARPVVEYSGVYGQVQVENKDLLSSQVSDRQSETQENAEGGATSNEDPQGLSNAPLVQFVQSIVTFNSEDWTESFDASTWEQMRIGFSITLVAVVLILIGAIVFRHCFRWIRLKRWDALPLGERAIRAYRYLCKGFEKLGFSKAPSATPLEYAFDQQSSMIPFTKGTANTDFIDVTLIYQRAAYGIGIITAEEWGKIERYYRSFFKNARAWVGSVRWLWYFWKI